MVFEPTFDELQDRAAELVTGGDPDAEVTVGDDDIDAASADGGDADGLAEAADDGALRIGDVEADDLPPEGA